MKKLMFWLLLLPAVAMVSCRKEDRGQPRSKPVLNTGVHIDPDGNPNLGLGIDGNGAPRRVKNAGILIDPNGRPVFQKDAGCAVDPNGKPANQKSEGGGVDPGGKPGA